MKTINEMKKKLNQFWWSVSPESRSDTVLYAGTAATLTVMFALCSIVIWSHFKVVQQADINQLAGYDVDEAIIRAENIGFPEVYLQTLHGLTDPHFFRHGGYVIADDLFSGVSSMRNGGRFQYSITRQISSTLLDASGPDGVRKKLYRDYLLPLKLEKEYSKNQLLHWYAYLLQKDDSGDIRRIFRKLFGKEFRDADRYESLFMLSLLYTASLKHPDSMSLDPAFRYLANRFYRNNPGSENEMQHVLKRYESEFNRHTDRLNSFHSARRLRLSGYGGAIYFVSEVRDAALRHNSRFPLLLAVVQAESNGDPYAVSRAGAIGIAQIMPATAADVLGVPKVEINELFRVDLNLDIAARYLNTIEGWVDQAYPGLTEDQKITLIAAAYNAGWTRVRRANGVPPIRETRDYVKRVMRYYRLYNANEEIVRRY